MEGTPPNTVVAAGMSNTSTRRLPPPPPPPTAGSEAAAKLFTTGAFPALMRSETNTNYSKPRSKRIYRFEMPLTPKQHKPYIPACNAGLEGGCYRIEKQIKDKIPDGMQPIQSKFC